MIVIMTEVYLISDFESIKIANFVSVIFFVPKKLLMEG